MSRKKRWIGRIFLGRDEEGKQQYHWVGRYDTRRERDEAVRLEHNRLEAEGCRCPACVKMGKFQGVASSGIPLVRDQVKRYLADYERRNRGSSLSTQRGRLKRLVETFGDRSIDIPRAELKDWLNAEGQWEGEQPVALGDRQGIVSFFNHAINEDDVPLAKSPARGLGERYLGRVNEPPPTEEEFALLLESCSALGKYEPMMRGMFLYAAFTLSRPSELFALRPEYLDFRRNRVRKAKRVYRGTEDDPKTGPKTIALTPPAREAIAPLDLTGEYVFTSKRGKRMSAGALSIYWNLVQIKADLEFDFYHATKHYGVWFMWRKLGLSDAAIAAQAGWKLSTVQKMLETYGHGEVGALEEVDAAFAREPKQAGAGLRLIAGGKQ